MDLAKLDPTLKLQAVGMIGNDPEANFIEQHLKQFPNISLDGLKRNGKTSFTIVMCENSTKQRTFFHYRGANASLSEDLFNWDQINAKILHIGYILLLDALDVEDAQYGTKMARLLVHAKEKGIETSIDVVSEAGNRFERLVPPSLKYTDYCIINELEAQSATGFVLRDERGTLLSHNLSKSLERLFMMGVSKWAIIHSPEGGFGMDSKGNLVTKKSLILPDGYIKGTVGAGDAFCSGVLYAAYNEKPLEEAIVMGIAAAACSLSKAGSTEGMREMQEAMKLYFELNK
jgi:sugar/nucleoside kinase (ribokinase family)